MADRFVNTGFVSNTSGTAPVLAATSLTAGNLIVVSIRWSSGSSTATSLTDTAGNTYTKIGTSTVGTEKVEMWYCANALGHATNVVQINFASSGSFVYARSCQWSGYGSTPFVTYDTSAGPASQTYVVNDLTTTAVDQLIVVAANIHTGGTNWTWPYPSGLDDATIFTQRGDDGTLGVASAETNLSGIPHVITSINNFTTNKHAIAALFTANPTVSSSLVVTQEVVEVVDGLSTDVQLTQQVVEVVDGLSTDVRLTQELMEVVDNLSHSAKISQTVQEIITGGSIGLSVNQSAMEVLTYNVVSGARVYQSVVEVLSPFEITFSPAPSPGGIHIAVGNMFIDS